MSGDGPEAGAQRPVARGGGPTGARTAEGRPERTKITVPPPCDLTLGLVCTDKSVPGRTTWVMAGDERFANPVGVVQGGFVVALCDSAMGASTITWARHRGLRVVAANVELKCSFVRPARVGSTLTCTAWVLEGGRRTCFAEAEVHDEDQRMVAKSSSTYLLTEQG